VLDPVCNQSAGNILAKLGTEGGTFGDSHHPSALDSYWTKGCPGAVRSLQFVPSRVNSTHSRGNSIAAQKRILGLTGGVIRQNARTIVGNALRAIWARPLGEISYERSWATQREIKALANGVTRHNIKGHVNSTVHQRNSSS
jgi:hypothetical protein